ncbi:hypothetical protein PSPO01_02439 [Paraphaeosphaeria sporulosa]
MSRPIRPVQPGLTCSSAHVAMRGKTTFIVKEKIDVNGRVSRGWPHMQAGKILHKSVLGVDVSKIQVLSSGGYE